MSSRDCLLHTNNTLKNVNHSMLFFLSNVMFSTKLNKQHFRFQHVNFRVSKTNTSHCFQQRKNITETNDFSFVIKNRKSDGQIVKNETF